MSEKIAVKSGYYFLLFDKNEVPETLKKSNMKVELGEKIYDLYTGTSLEDERKIDDLQYKLNRLKQICKPYVEAIRIAPEKVKAFIDDILVKAREKAKAEKVKEEIPYPPIRRKPKYKSKEDFER